MGGSQSVSQVQTYLDTKITNVVTETLVKKNTTTDQSNTGDQIIRNINLRHVNCPEGSFPGGYNFSNVKQLNMSTVINMANVSSAELTDTIKKTLESEAQSNVKNDKSGSLAVGDQTSSTQSVMVSDVTITNIRHTIDQTLSTYMKQKDSGNQIIDRVDAIAPCLVPGQAYPVMSNDSYIEMMASDISTAVVDTVMKSEEAKDFVNKNLAIVDVKNKDIIGQVADVANNLIAGVTTITTGIGVSSVVMFGLVLLAVVMLLPMLVRAITGGGGVSNEHQAKVLHKYVDRVSGAAHKGAGGATGALSNVLGKVLGKGKK